MPLPRADHRTPSHLAIFAASTSPAVRNWPPTYRAGPVRSSKTKSAVTFGARSESLIPLPRADHRVPSHLAIFAASTSPAVRNWPPAYRAGPVPSSNTDTAFTTPSVPVPSADHCVPFHLAMWLAATLPAVVKMPPAYRAAVVPSSTTTCAPTASSIPLALPSADHCIPFHLAT